MYVVNIFILTHSGQVISRTAMPGDTFLYKKEVQGIISTCVIDKRHGNPADIANMNAWRKNECCLMEEYAPASKMGFYGVKTI